MARKDFLPTDGKMSNNHNQNKMIREAAKEFGIPEMELSKEIHAQKNEWYGGDFTYQELREIAKELKERLEKRKRW